MTASFFAKPISRDAEHIRDSISDNDLCKATLEMVTNNVGQLAYMATRLEVGIHDIVFAGNFLRDNQISMHCLARAIHFWSDGKAHALFLRHEGYHGAVGGLLLHECTTKS